MNDNCIGIIGRIFGHIYKPVYESDVEYYSANEKLNMMKTEFWTGSITKQIKGLPSIAEQPKRVTKVLQGYLCPRCGNFIKNEIKLD